MSQPFTIYIFALEITMPIRNTNLSDAYGMEKNTGCYIIINNYRRSNNTIKIFI